MSQKSKYFQKLIIKYQLVLFFFLAYLLSWWSLPVLRGQLPHGVMFAAIIVVGLIWGRAGLRRYWKELINTRARWWLFLISPVIIISFKFFDAISSLMTGATFTGFSQISFVMIAGELLLLGGLWEEPGWSGYALPKLQKRFANSKYGVLIATLILGIFRGIWHIPLLIVGAIPWYDVFWFTPFVFQPFISWLYNKSKGNVLVVMFFHYMSNLLFTLSPGFSGADEPLHTILYMTFGGIATTILIWKTRYKLGLSQDL